MPVSHTKSNTEDGARRLRIAYAEFLRELADFEKKERALGGQIKKAVDQERIHSVLQKIVDIKN